MLCGTRTYKPGRSLSTSAAARPVLIVLFYADPLKPRVVDCVIE